MKWWEIYDRQYIYTSYRMIFRHYSRDIYLLVLDEWQCHVQRQGEEWIHDYTELNHIWFLYFQDLLHLVQRHITFATMPKKNVSACVSSFHPSFQFSLWYSPRQKFSELPWCSLICNSPRQRITIDGWFTGKGYNYHHYRSDVTCCESHRNLWATHK